MTAAGPPRAAGAIDPPSEAPDAQERAGSGPAARAAGPAHFAHASEAEMARILDFYGVRWEYEPHTFPILWNLDGDVVESFSPDFYLPDLDAYLEITTLRQKLVRKKNRKLRRLRELYPGLQVKLFYARDFRALLLKYGKLALAASLSGSEGQVGGGTRLLAGVATRPLDPLGAAPRLSSAAGERTARAVPAAATSVAPAPGAGPRPAAAASGPVDR